MRVMLICYLLWHCQQTSGTRWVLAVKSGFTFDLMGGSTPSLTTINKNNKEDMTEAKITLHSRPKDPTGSIHIHLPFDVPEELMKALTDQIAGAFEEWEDIIIIASRT